MNLILSHVLSFTHPVQSLAVPKSQVATHNPYRRKAIRVLAWCVVALVWNVVAWNWALSQ